MSIILTEKAELRLRAFLKGSADRAVPDKGIRLGVKDGGCNGYQYTLDVTSIQKPDDIVEQIGKVRVYVDPQSAPLLNGVVVDYVDGLLESGFKFENPNATGSCGCGQSFQAGECTPAAVPCS